MLIRAAVVTFVALTLTTGIGCSSDDDSSGPDATAVSADAGDPLPYMAECDTNEQCETELCFSFNAKGPHCTHSCVIDADCESPSPGCNNMGVCKAPDL